MKFAICIDDHEKVKKRGRKLHRFGNRVRQSDQYTRSFHRPSSITFSLLQPQEPLHRSRPQVRTSPLHLIELLFQLHTLLLCRLDINIQSFNLASHWFRLILTSRSRAYASWRGVSVGERRLHEQMDNFPQAHRGKAAGERNDRGHRWQ